MKKLLCVLCVLCISVLCFSSCGKKNTENIWSDALYTEDTKLGEGEKTVYVDVVAEGKKVVFTLCTNAVTLGDSLVETKLVSGENGAYGLYIKSVNGIVADFDKNGAYWSVTKGGEYLMSGVDDINISGGEHYELTYTR